MAKPTQPVRGRPRQSSDVPLAGRRQLDRDSEVPLYFQLAAELHRMLELGTWEPGARFPTERELEEEFDVSRAVIRPALDLLVGDGTIFRIKGSGAFVAAPRTRVKATGLVKLWANSGHDHSVSVASVRKRMPDRTVSKFLELDESLTEIAQVTAAVDTGEPSAFVVDSYSVDLPHSMAPSHRRSFSERRQPPAAWRAGADQEHRYGRAHFLQWVVGVPGGLQSGQSGADRALRPVRPEEGGDAGAARSSSPA